MEEVLKELEMLPLIFTQIVEGQFKNLNGKCTNAKSVAKRSAHKWFVLKAEKLRNMRVVKR